jgi:hypothetical protein
MNHLKQLKVTKGEKNYCWWKFLIDAIEKEQRKFWMQLIKKRTQQLFWATWFSGIQFPHQVFVKSKIEILEPSQN